MVVEVVTNRDRIRYSNEYLTALEKYSKKQTIYDNKIIYQMADNWQEMVNIQKKDGTEMKLSEMDNYKTPEVTTPKYAGDTIWQGATGAPNCIKGNVEGAKTATELMQLKELAVIAENEGINKEKLKERIIKHFEGGGKLERGIKSSSVCCEDPSGITKHKGEDKKMQGYYSVYDVIVVDKDSLEIVIDESVVAKTKKHAKGKAGVYDYLKDKEYDDTKLVVKVALIEDVKPYDTEEDG